MDIGSYFNYALRLWKFDESAAQELRDSEASSFWMSFLLIAIFGAIIGSVSVVAEMFNPINDLAGIGIALYLVGGIIGSIILVPLFYLLGMLWSQMWINIFGGDRKFLKTFEVFACIYIPSFIVGFIFVFFLLNSVFDIVVNFLGYSIDKDGDLNGLSKLMGHFWTYFIGISIIGLTSVLAYRIFKIYKGFPINEIKT